MPITQVDVKLERWRKDHYRQVAIRIYANCPYLNEELLVGAFNVQPGEGPIMVLLRDCENLRLVESTGLQQTPVYTKCVWATRDLIKSEQVGTNTQHSSPLFFL